MIQSMTGYGKSDFEFSGKQYSIDVKSLNSKNIDLNIRVPLELKSKELAIRKIISEKLKRGKIDVFINVSAQSETKAANINTELIRNYMTMFEQVNPELDLATRFKAAMRMPDILMNETEELSDEEWTMLQENINLALEQLTVFREDEGKILKKEFEERIANINSLLSQVPVYEEERISKLKKRILTSLEEIAEVDGNRMEQELVYYLEKLDITEEKLRLKNHCDYFLEALNTHESNGKKLNFIGQEIGREINTLGAKSNHAELQKIVVQMKDELEKIKEQILNVK